MGIVKGFILALLLTPQLCPNCFTSRWKVKTVAVDCQFRDVTAAELIGQGYTVSLKVYKTEDGFKMCDFVGIK